MGRRCKDQLYSSEMKINDFCTNLQLGEINASTGNFVAWQVQARPALKMIQISEKDTMYKLFYQKNRGPHWPEWHDDSIPADPMEDQVPQSTAKDSRQRYNLVARNNVMCYPFFEKNSKEPEWVAVCDFELTALAAMYMFVEDDHGDPYDKIICRTVLNERGEGSYLLRSEDTNRSPHVTGYKYFDIEVLVQIGKLRTNADVKSLFKKHHSRLQCTSMTPDMLACWIAEQPKPPITSCIVRFGALSPL
jgi:PIN domain nuclease of toxin-antitoxin system